MAGGDHAIEACSLPIAGTQVVERVDRNALGSSNSQTSALGSMRSTFN
jgi:hypothetical protein